MSYPVCLVEIFGAEEQWTFMSEVNENQPYGSSPSSDLLSCRTEKHVHYANPAGRFTLTLAYHPDSQGRTWADRIRPQDLVVIQMLNHGQAKGPHGQGDMHTVMIGLVSTTTETAGVDSGGIPQRQITVTGQDFGKLFQQGNVTYWSFAGASLLGVKEFVNVDQLNGQPHQVVAKLIDDLFFTFMQPKWVWNEQTVAFKDVLGYALTSYQSLFPGGLDWQFIQSEEAFWAFFVKVASVPFHEVYLDTRRASDLIGIIQHTPQGSVSVGNIRDESGAVIPGFTFAESALAPKGSLVKVPSVTYGRDGSVPCLVLRPPPFPLLSPDKQVTTDAWDSRPQHMLSADMGIEVQQQTLSRSDQEQFNLYLIYPRGGVLSEFQHLLMVPPIIDQPKFHKYGYRPLVPHVSLLNAPTSTSQGDPWLGFYKELAWALAGWNVLNDQFLSGTKTMQLAPHIHVGERLLDQSTWHHAPGSQAAGQEFYIESVRHEFVTHQHAKTTLGVTRGLLENDARSYPAVLGQAANDLVNIGFNARQTYLDLLGKGHQVP